MIDARVLNWRYTVPAQRRRLLLLPRGEERLQHAAIPERSREGLERLLAGEPYDTVAAPDLAVWARAVEIRPAQLLRCLAGAVAPGGWLYAGFPNAWYPIHPRRPGSLSLGGAGGAVRAAGLAELQPYLLLPDQGCPAFLIGAGRRHELDYFLSQISFPYSRGRSAHAARLRGVLLAGATRVAKRGPHRLRVRLAPALAVVARRPE